MKTETQENNFQKLLVFENERLNEDCDLLICNIKTITGENAYLTGSVARLLEGVYPDDYQVKDIDFVVSEQAFRMISSKRKEILPCISVELRPERIILYLSPVFCIEIWFFKEKKQEIIHKIFKNKIHYVCRR